MGDRSSLHRDGRGTLILTRNYRKNVAYPGVHPFVAQRLIRHKSLAMTERYTRRGASGRQRRAVPAKRERRSAGRSSGPRVVESAPVDRSRFLSEAQLFQLHFFACSGSDLPTLFPTHRVAGGIRNANSTFWTKSLGCGDKTQCGTGRPLGGKSHGARRSVGRELLPSLRRERSATVLHARR
jgi:hypothetical protein